MISTAFIVGICVGVCVITYLLLYKRLNPPEITKEETIFIPEIIIMHERPEAYWHYETGPHANCNCRVCNLQRRVNDVNRTV